jgi:DNA-binding NarL/FixJ family response regulator
VILFLSQPVQHHHSVNLVLNSKWEQTINNHSLVRILLVDDFAPWRRFVIEKLRENNELRIVGVVSDGLEAIQKAGELQPDLILLDLGLPKANGIVAARRIRNLAPNSKILFLSQTLDLDVVHAALREGAHGFVVKSDAGNELFAAIEQVMQGKKFVSRRLAGLALPGGVDSSSIGPLQDGTNPSSTSPLLLKREVSRCHEVHFYSDDSALLDGFSSFLGAALKAGNAAVFIGTTSHKITLLERLHAETPETRMAIREGGYLALNVFGFLSDFIVSGGMPDTDRFLQAVDNLIVSMRKGEKGEHLRIAACSECAHILWTQGNADAAIRLEELWNEISKTYDVDILCGYSLESLRCEEDSYTFRRICEEHSAVHSL